MLKDIKKQIEYLDEKKSNLNADFSTRGNGYLLDFYVKTIPKVLNAERCSIFIYDPEHRKIWLKEGTDVKERDIEISRDVNSVVGDVIATGNYKIISGLEDKNGVHRQIDQQTGFATRDILCIPIMSVDRRQVVGAVELLNKKDGTSFNDADRTMLEEMARHMQLTIENIYFNQETIDILDNLYGTMKKVILVFAAVVVLLVGLLVVL